MLETRHAAYRDTPIGAGSGSASIRALPAATRFSLRVKGVPAPSVSPGAKSVIARSASDEATQRPQPDPSGLLRSARNDGIAQRSPSGEGFPALDLPINRFVAAGERVFARLGPDEWLILGSEDDGTAAAEIEAGLAGRFHALVDISHRNVAITVSGPGAADILNAGCPLDLHPGAFPPGSATRTILGKAEIVLLRERDDLFRVECWRSFAHYVHSFLLEAARDV